MIANYLGVDPSPLAGFTSLFMNEWLFTFDDILTHDDGDPPGEHYEKLQVAHANLWLNTKFYKG